MSFIENPTTSVEIRFVGDMAKVTAQPGDIFVITCDVHLSQDTAERLRRQVQKFLPDLKLLVLGKGMSLEVMNAARALARLDVASRNAG